MDVKQFSRYLRKNMTDAEKLLWRYLRMKQIRGYKFRRQSPIGDYIVDFVCFEKKIVVELDGGQHNAEKQKDILRDRWLKSQGFRMLRFWNHEVMKNPAGVLEEIINICGDPHPSLPHQGGGEQQ